MQRTLPTRRRPRYGAQVCAVIAALLLLLSVSILHSRLKFNPNSHHQFQNLEFTQDPIDDLDAIVANPLLEDVENDGLANNVSGDDLIDELDVVEEEQSKVSDEEEILRGLEDDSESDGGFGLKTPNIKNKRSGYYWDHVVGARRRAFDKQLIDPWEDMLSSSGSEDRSRVAFASDDQPLNEDVRAKFDLIRGIEDALLLKIGKHNSPLREGWASWFEKKGDFLRRDRMFRPNLELLNPANNPLLQDPDGVGSTFLTRGDKLMQKSFLSEVGMKHTRVVVSSNQGSDMRRGMMQGNEIREVDIRNGNGNDVTRLERRTLDNDGRGIVHDKNIETSSDKATHNEEVNNGTDKGVDPPTLKTGQQIDTNKLDTEKQFKSELSDHIYADGKRWGYFPGLSPELSFSEFMDEFFAKGKCSMRAFMVWNSSPWMYTVRHQRSLESLLYHNPDACVVVFTETVELDFFEAFVKDGYKVAVAMPNLDELLKDTPAHVFASVWFEWRKTKFYPVHYSELVRLASLYKYGGLYLDSDMIVLKPLSSLNNSIATEDESAKSSFNGAVMLFRKNSPFILECLREFYSTYDDTLLRWNGADLLTRTAKKFLTQEKSFDEQLELKIQPPSMFFPIRSQDITRYFKAPANEIERTQQYILLQKILEGSYTFHFWNNLTSSLVPEPESLVAKLLNHGCIRCNDVL